MDSLWRIPLPDDIPDDTCFYIDGSAVDIEDKQFVRLGYSIIAVGAQGELRGVGYGSPPSWVIDSAGAETWAFYTVLSLCPICPPVVTDCLGIVNVLRNGRTRANSQTRADLENDLQHFGGPRFCC